MLSKLYRCAAPVSRGDIGDGRRERPDVAAGILDAVLPLAERVALRRLVNLRAMLLRMCIVVVGVRHPHEHRVARVWPLARGPLGQDNRTAPITDVQLDAMVSDDQSLPEAKDLAEPSA